MTLTRILTMSTLAAFAAGLVPPAAWAAEPPPIPAEAQEEAVWYAVIDGQKVGPLTESAVLRQMDQGAIRPETLLWREGLDGWVKAAEAHEFQARRIADRLKSPRNATPTDNRFIVSQTL